jgi:hypothetical protein
MSSESQVTFTGEIFGELAIRNTLFNSNIFGYSKRITLFFFSSIYILLL